MVDFYSPAKSGSKFSLDTDPDCRDAGSLPYELIDLALFLAEIVDLRWIWLVVFLVFLAWANVDSIDLSRKGDLLDLSTFWSEIMFIKPISL